jgi:hypothetical protein
VIDVFAAFEENRGAMVSIENRSIVPNFQGAGLPGSKGVL